MRGELLPRELPVENNRLEEDPLSTFQIAFANGIEAWNIPAGQYEFEVVGESGSIRSINNGVRVAHRRAGTSTNPSPNSVLQDVPWSPRPEWEDVTFELPDPGSPIVACLQDLLDAYESGRPSRGNVKVTHNITEACLAVVESHQRGGAWVQLPLENRDLYAFHA